MDRLELDIGQLQTATAEIGKIISDTKETDKAAHDTNKKLTSRGTWEGDGANAYRSKADEWKKNVKENEKSLDKISDGMKTMLKRAEDLNRQALKFATIFGGSNGSGNRNILTYDPNGKAYAKTSCDTAIQQIQSLDELATKAERLLGGIDGNWFTSDISAYRRKLKDRKNKLCSLNQAISRYASDAETFVGVAGRTFDSVGLPKTAQTTLKSWQLALKNVVAGFKGISEKCNKFVGDPVNMATGNFVYEKTYLRQKGAIPLSFGMFYNSTENRAGALGRGWTHNFGLRLENGGEQATLWMGDGCEKIFFKNDDGTYTQSFNEHDTLKKTQKGHAYQNADQTTYHFDEQGRVAKIEDPIGNFAAIIYEEGKFSRVESNNGGCLAYEYTPEGQISRVSDHAGRSVSLEYDGGRLAAVTDEEGREQRYLYDGEGRIVGIVNPAGVRILENEYDASSRVTKQTFADGGAMRFDYRDGDMELVVTEQNGSETTYVRDDRMRTTAEIDSDGAERYSYNEQNRRVWQIDRNGNETRFGYDDNGNLSEVTNALGETMNVEYDSRNKPVKVSLCDVARLSNEYDSKGNLLRTSDALGRTRTLEYGENGLPIRMTMPDGSAIEMEYDGRGNIARISGDGIPETRYEYDACNRATASTDGNGNTTRFSYDDKNALTKVVAADGSERTYEYNQTGKLAKVTDFDGSAVQYEYDGMGSPVRFVDPCGRETRLEYDLMWNVTKMTDANGAATLYEYDDRRRIAKVTDALGHAVSYGYDSNGNRTSVTDPHGGETRMEYDALNRVVSVAAPDGARTSFAYNEMGQVASVTDAMGNARAFEYDAAGQKTGETDAMGNKVAYTYTSLGKISTVTDPAGRAMSYEYAPGGLLTREVGPDGCWTSYEYDAAKNVVAKRIQSGYALYYAYDSRGRIAKITSSEGQEKSYAYDAVSRVTSMTDANGNVTRYAYSAAGKLAQVIDASGNATEYGYDSMDNLIKIEQRGRIDGDLAEANALNAGNGNGNGNGNGIGIGNGNGIGNGIGSGSVQPRITTYDRNILGQIESIEDALGRRETFEYDALGRVVGRTDRDGFLTRFAYGANGQIEHIQYADGRTARFAYDSLRRLSEIRDWLGLTTIETEPLGRASKVRDHSGNAVEHRYGSVGEPLETTYPDGTKATYIYDDIVRISEIEYGGSVISYEYDENGRLSGKHCPNGISTRCEYDPAGLLAALTHSDGDGVIDRYAYRYDSMCNKTAVEKYRRGMEGDSGLFGYGYDALGRLTEATRDGAPLRSYEYDAFGNRTQMAAGGERTSYTYNALNQMIRAESPGMAREYVYDGRGNMTQALENGIAAHTCAYGAHNRLEKAFDAGGAEALYRYNALGQRVSSQIADGQNPMREIDYVLDLTKQYHNLLQTDDGVRTRSYIWDFGVAAEAGADGARFYMHDELGSPLRYADAGGAIIDSYAYDEFGADLTANQGIAQPFGYTGYRSDGISGTYFAQAREYAPETGRFAATDVLKGLLTHPMTLNEYTYCRNRPMSMIDLDGMEEESVVLGWFRQRAKSIGELIGGEKGAQVAEAFVDSVANTGIGQSAVKFADDLYEDWQNYDETNSDEMTVVHSNYFSSFNGKPVFRLGAGGRSFSFGAMFIAPGVSNYSEKDAIATVRHEYGHTVHLEQLGTVPYLFTVAIPSMTSTGKMLELYKKLFGVNDYYELPWDLIPDLLGGVDPETRRHSPEAIMKAEEYYATIGEFVRFQRNLISISNGSFFVKCYLG